MKSQEKSIESVDFSRIRYAQVWEDADVLLEGLDVQAGDVCVSIASAGDNTFSIVSRGPAKVIAVDLSGAQLACVELRKSAYASLQHEEFLELIGSKESKQRATLYAQCRKDLTESAAAFWDPRADLIRRGIGAVGKFERYFAIFRRIMMPMVHSRRTVRQLFQVKSKEERCRFYEAVWDNRRWRGMFRIFFSRQTMGLLGRDPAFFRHVSGPVAERILERTRHALVELDPMENPYLQWILLGRHDGALPHALRSGTFNEVRKNLGCLELRRQSMEAFLDTLPDGFVHKWNLSDIFEYMSESAYVELLKRIALKSVPNARLLYWNMLAPRSRPDSMKDVLRSEDALASRLHARDKAFFYSRLNLEIANPSG